MMDGIMTDDVKYVVNIWAPAKTSDILEQLHQDIDTWYYHETLRNDRGDTKNDDHCSHVFSRMYILGLVRCWYRITIDYRPLKQKIAPLFKGYISFGGG